jgi:hypothetical protein
MIPSGCRVHLPVTSPTSSAFPKSSLWVGFPNRPAKRLRAAGVSRSSPFLTFRPPGLLATQVSPTAAPQRPQGSRDFSTRATHASLPMHASGMLAVRIRQLTAVGLSPPKTCSLVGRYPGFEPATLRLTGGKNELSRALPPFAGLCRTLRQPAKNLPILRFRLMPGFAALCRPLLLPKGKKRATSGRDP